MSNNGNVAIHSDRLINDVTRDSSEFHMPQKSSREVVFFLRKCSPKFGNVVPGARAVRIDTRTPESVIDFRIFVKILKNSNKWS